MIRKIGEEFEFRGVRLRVEKYSGSYSCERGKCPCEGCVFEDGEFAGECHKASVRDVRGLCCAGTRSDKTDVIFRKVE